MKLDILGVSETHWKGIDKFIHEQRGVRYKIVYSSGDEIGVAIIMKGKEVNAIKHYTLSSERCMCMTVGTHPIQ